MFTGTWKGFLKMNCTFPVRSPNAAKYNTVGLVCSLADGDVTLMPKTSIEFGKGTVIFSYLPVSEDIANLFVPL